MEMNTIAERQKAFFEKNRTKSYEFRQESSFPTKTDNFVLRKRNPRGFVSRFGKIGF